MNKEKLPEMNRAYCIITLLALFLHFTYMTVFFLKGEVELGFYNLGSALLYSILCILSYKNYLKLVTCLVHIEVTLFVIISTLLLGWDFGFYAFLIAMCAMLYFNPFKRKQYIYIFCVAEIMIFFVLRAWEISGSARIITDRGTVIFFSCFNYLSCFVLIFVGALVSKIATERLERDHYLMTHDELTGIYNRNYFLKR